MTFQEKWNTWKIKVVLMELWRDQSSHPPPNPPVEEASAATVQGRPHTLLVAMVLLENEHSRKSESSRLTSLWILVDKREEDFILHFNFSLGTY
jgi:hypothetical protein